MLLELPILRCKTCFLRRSTKRIKGRTSPGTSVRSGRRFRAVSHLQLMSTTVHKVAIEDEMGTGFGGEAKGVEEDQQVPKLAMDITLATWKAT